MPRSIEEMSVTEVYCNGLDLIAFIVNNHSGSKAQLKRQLNVALDAIQMTAFKKNFPDLADLMKDGYGSYKPTPEQHDE